MSYFPASRRRRAASRGRCAIFRGTPPRPPLRSLRLPRAARGYGLPLRGRSPYFLTGGSPRRSPHVALGGVLPGGGD